jgi:hypothetical protein
VKNEHLVEPQGSDDEIEVKEIPRDKKISKKAMQNKR